MADAEDDSDAFSLADMFHPAGNHNQRRVASLRDKSVPSPPLDTSTPRTTGRPTKPPVTAPPPPTPVHRKYKKKQSQVDKLLELKRNAQRVANQL